jgi:hypothetical protein
MCYQSHRREKRMAERSSLAHKPPPKSKAMIAAEAALAKAQAMPWGPERLEALRDAGALRNAAINKELLSNKS